jgi:predicted amidophosphoribosyltransferase
VPGIDVVVALFAHEGVGRGIVAAVKYRNRRQVVAWLAAAMAAALAERCAPPVGVVTWIPASRERVRRSGFDPGAELASAVGRCLGAPSERLLTRARREPPQTGRSRSERLRGPRLSASRRPSAGRVLVVDDVVTTGSSLRVAAGVLRATGAVSVSAAVVAHRPNPDWHNDH